MGDDLYEPSPVEEVTNETVSRIYQFLRIGIRYVVILIYIYDGDIIGIYILIIYRLEEEEVSSQQIRFPQNSNQSAFKLK